MAADHQYSTTFELLRSPILNQLIQKLAKKLVHRFKSVGVHSSSNINAYQNFDQNQQDLLNILLEMKNVLPLINFKKGRTLLAPYRINFYRLVIHFVIGIFCLGDSQLSEKFRMFYLPDQQRHTRHFG